MCIRDSFQTACDHLQEQRRQEVLMAWKSLWLDKTAQFLRYQKTLKRVWTVDFSHSVNYDTNVLLNPNDSTTSVHSDEEDIGIDGQLGLTLRPFINMKKIRNWSLQTQLVGDSRIQASVKEVESNTVDSITTLTFDKINSFMDRVQTVYSYKRSYSQAPLNPRMDFGQHSGTIRLKYYPMNFNNFCFSSGSWRTNLDYRVKTEFADRANALAKQSLDSYGISVGQNFLRLGKNIAFQTYGWDIKYEKQDVSPDITRDYDSVSLGLSYSRKITKILPKMGLTWRTNARLQLKDWGSVVASTATEDEAQTSLSSSLGARWSANWSSLFTVSYLNKNQD